jgi:predicted transcriptional regulator
MKPGPNVQANAILAHMVAQGLIAWKADARFHITERGRALAQSEGKP